MHKYTAIFHANLNYAFLEEKKYEQVIRASYETIIDVFRDKCPDARYTFEASGFTIEQMAEKTPDVLQKLKAAIASGQCEFMGAPHSHPIMANIPEEDGRWSCEFAQRSYEKFLGFRAESFWNPECTWMQYVPKAFRDAGVKYLTLDFESYMTCNDKEYGWIERNRTSDIGWGGHLPVHDLDPDCKFMHYPFRDVVPGMHGFCRSDRLVGKYIKYFLSGLPLEEYLENVKKWTPSDGKGATIIIADDAEYCGTTGYFFVKHYQDYSQSFTIKDDAAEKLEKLVNGIMEIGEMVTFKEACQLEPVEEPFYVEDRFAWHKTYADAWAGTPEARTYDPILTAIRHDYSKNVQPIAESKENAEQFKELVEKYWFHVTSAANSDGRWPPPPAITCPFNREWVENQIDLTKYALAELKKAVTGLPMPKAETDEKVDNDWTYGLNFTEKDVLNVEKLNIYELQHAMYYANKRIDSKTAEKKQEGLDLLKRIYTEWEKRGVDSVLPDSIK